jgi:predicted Zn-dependent protease
MEQANVDWLAATLRGDGRAAYESARMLRELTPMSPFAAQAAFEALKINRPKEAVAWLTSLDPARGSLRTWGFYWERLTQAHHLLGNHREELAAARQGRALQPEQPSSRLGNEVRALAALGEAGDVVRLVNGLVKSTSADSADGAGDVVLTAARELRAHDKEAEARSVLEGLITWARRLPSPEGTSPNVQWLLAQATAERGDCIAAKRYLDPLIANDPQDLRFRGYAAMCDVSQGDRAAAARADAWLASLTRPYLRGEHTLWRARIAAMLGERDQAVALLREAFNQGTWYSASLHADFGLAALRGYAPYEELMRPKG